MMGSAAELMELPVAGSDGAPTDSAACAWPIKVTSGNNHTAPLKDLNKLYMGAPFTGFSPDFYCNTPASFTGIAWDCRTIPCVLTKGAR
jgi:hypothetical protein